MTRDSSCIPVMTCLTCRFRLNDIVMILKNFSFWTAYIHSITTRHIYSFIHLSSLFMVHSWYFVYHRTYITLYDQT
ncbi:hypothetical protein L210DRAFT_3219605 [Boletus edulis BED1]|uniref:Uncharacterized protein n=1 Tax=Boletus edulis BED1 TaxID=1328754 RepID=A0AAD4BEW2_BOLED|nr:hypothetical protein L210DRAFT_3219605 [Boletus edulis BED1]